MKIRIYNAVIFTLEDNRAAFNGELWVEDNIITYVGETKKTDDIVFDKEINAEENLLMPSFKNAHTHSAMTFGRNYSDTLRCNEWLEKVIFPIEAKMTENDVYELSKVSFLEYIMNGITACFDMYYEPQAMSQLAKEYGFRTVMCGAVNNFRETPESIEKAFLKYNAMHEFASYKFGIHAEYTCSLELLEKMADLVRKYKAPFYTHISETESEVSGCIKRYGKSPVELLDSIGLFDYGGGVFHGVFLTDEELRILSKKNVSIITNPASNLKLASGIARVMNFVDYGINVGIGTDGPASNNSLDMFKEMYLTSVLQKYRLKDAAACAPELVIAMATKGSAKAMGLYNCDVLAVGKLADIIMIDLHKPNMQPLNNIPNAIVYSANPMNVKMTMINGKIVYYNNEFFIDDDIDKVYSGAKQIVLKLSK